MRTGAGLNADRDIVLLGLRGSGKSTIGALLAERLGREFIDLDDRTLDLLRAERGAQTIAEVFEQHGEDAFRDAEARALRAAFERSDPGAIVLALGGGTPTAAGAVPILRASGAVLVYLRLRPERLAERLRGNIDHRRPALTDQKDAIAEIAEVHERRDALYASLADISISDEDAPPEMARELMRRIASID
jgi:shikimate kinase